MAQYQLIKVKAMITPWEVDELSSNKKDLVRSYKLAASHDCNLGSFYAFDYQ
jgi:hypothetical protein